MCREGEYTMSQTLSVKSKTKGTIFTLLAHRTRQEILSRLEQKNLTHIELRGLIRKIEIKRNGSIINYHLRTLRNHNLIKRNERTGLYNITYRGLVVVKAMKEINESEMFI